MLLFKRNIFLSFIIIYTISSCSNTSTKFEEKPKKKIEKWVEGAEFNADSAYKFITNQVNYGPRVPNTSNHEKCGDWLVNKLKSMGCKVTEQKGEVIAFNGAKLPVRNIIANLKSVISTLYENGLVGLAATLILISFLIPTFKFYYLLAKNRKINIQLIRSALTPSKSEKNFIFPAVSLDIFPIGIPGLKSPPSPEV